MQRTIAAVCSSESFFCAKFRFFSKCFTSAFLGNKFHMIKRKKTVRQTVQYVECFEYNKISCQIFKGNEYLSFPLFPWFCQFQSAPVLTWEGDQFNNVCLSCFPFFVCVCVCVCVCACVPLCASLRDSTRSERFISQRVSQYTLEVSKCPFLGLNHLIRLQDFRCL